MTNDDDIAAPAPGGEKEAPAHERLQHLGAIVTEDWRPRAYQGDAWRALCAGATRVVLVWHRRAGKDTVALAWTIREAVAKPGVYWHIFPTAKQGRKIIWDGVTKEGRPFLSYWPKTLIAAKNEAEMKLKLVSGSVWQVVGADNYDEALIGGNPRGLVLSEYALQNPSCWNYLRPILAENGGWAIFPFTPRGRNHAWKLFERTREGDPRIHFAQRLTVEDTGAITREAIEQERRDGMPEELIEQEFYCSFEAPLAGSYYGQLLRIAEDEKRIASVPHDPALPVETWWDLGMNDQTAIWFVERAGREIRVIDYYQASGKGLDHYAKVLSAKPWAYSRHLLPHDIEVRELGAGCTRLETLTSLGVVTPTARCVVVPRMNPAERINAVRQLLPRCWFDRERCAVGLEALRQYQREWDDKGKIYRHEPRHDWTSHAADAFGHGAVMLRDPPLFASPAIAESRYDPLGGLPPSLGCLLDDPLS